MFQRVSPCRYISFSDLNPTSRNSPLLPSGPPPSQLYAYYPRRHSKSRPDLPPQKKPPSGPIPPLPVSHETIHPKACEIEELIWKYRPSEQEIRLDNGMALFRAMHNIPGEGAGSSENMYRVSWNMDIHGNIVTPVYFRRRNLLDLDPHCHLVIFLQMDECGLLNNTCWFLLYNISKSRGVKLFAK